MTRNPIGGTMTHEEILARIRASAAQRILFLPHATRQMMRPDRMISTSDVRMVIDNGEIIENYPNDARGHSCLVLGFGDHRRFIHVVCAPNDEYLAIISAYLPVPEKWSTDFKERIT